PRLATESQGLEGLVTQIDRYSEELLIAMLKESYPTHSFLGEEFGLQEGKGNDKDWCWVIDPLDGTHNFIHGLHYQRRCTLTVTYRIIREDE
ncbi:hypothetical protein J8J20_21840, partial [Mycobacterium tuberculosis]|nr:hypothetical protein [Mycobacterium tuberculosis]